MKILNHITSFIFGIIVTAITVWLVMPSMMLSEQLSPYSINETVKKISANAKVEGWVI